MKRYYFYLFVLLFGLPLLVVRAQGAACAERDEIIINGSTTLLPAVQKAGEAFMEMNPGINLAISGGGSGNGIKALMEGLCDLAMSSRHLKASEQREAGSKGLAIAASVVAVDALVPVVHPDNPVSGVSIEQLRDVYAGRIRNWKELGGKDERIVVISRDSSSGTYEGWEEIVMQKERVAPSALLQASSGAVVQVVATNKKALGYVGLGYLKHSVKPLPVNGVSVAPFRADTWPIARELYLFYAQQPSMPVKRLLDYLLDPQRGQRAIIEAGYLPAPGVE